ncbi:UDP-N-acetylmuramate--L-alanine ligase [Deltaproteobacteria bacterium PRO3]|nr:UDP-N-acetylmuramate--L-alanine ligase [Deltaproteobacteria bacterium PRO3]
MFQRYQNLHFVGIGGIGMSGIAEVLLNLGYRISGSDQKRSPITARLKKKGARIHYGHKASHIEGAQVVVISSAVRPSNPEVVAAKKAGIPVIPRAEMLAELMRLKYGIAVAGSHGKTTTTSLVGQVLSGAGMDPTMVIGGRLNSLRSNAKLGKGEFLVAEADESDGSFLKLNPTIAVITNIDPEHLDHYKDFEALKETFVAFANKVPFYGSIVACADHPVVRELLPRFQRKVVTYGLESPADYGAEKMVQEGLRQRFTVLYRKEKLGEVVLQSPGRHSVANALAAIAVGRELDIPFRKIAAALKGFRGIERRFQVLCDNGVTVIDDYGHHPVEIRATLKALREAFPERRLIALFQPHRYTRTRDLFHDFAQSFGDADKVFLTEVYPAGEDPIVGVSSRALHDAMDQAKTVFRADKLSLIPAVLEQVQPGDVVLSLGAGDITKIGHELARQIKKAGGAKSPAP